jgi:hypothetical protein
MLHSSSRLLAGVMLGITVSSQLYLVEGLR